jgi:hypothetical protein
MELNKGYNDEPVCDLNSMLNYIKNNWIQLILLIVSFCVIYIVDYICNINYGLIETSINATATPLIKMTKKSKK